MKTKLDGKTWQCFIAYGGNIQKTRVEGQISDLCDDFAITVKISQEFCRCIQDFWECQTPHIKPVHNTTVLFQVDDCVNLLTTLVDLRAEVKV